MPNNKYTLQQSLCDQLGRINLCPPDGFCYACGRNIRDKISAEEAAGKYITFCPYCHHSFAE